MTQLSPAAQAVLTAQAKERCLFEWSALNDPPCHPSDADWNGCVQCIDRRGLAAALRALADQVAYGHGSSVKKSAIIDEDEVLAIATELENHQ